MRRCLRIKIPSWRKIDEVFKKITGVLKRKKKRGEIYWAEKLRFPIDGSRLVGLFWDGKIYLDTKISSHTEILKTLLHEALHYYFPNSREKMVRMLEICFGIIYSRNRKNRWKNLYHQKTGLEKRQKTRLSRVFS
jgi:hypothetical protein